MGPVAAAMVFHHGVLLEDHIEWSTEVWAEHTCVAVVDGGRLAGEACPGRPLSLETQQGVPDDALRLPTVDGALHRVRLEGGRFEPSDSGVKKGIGRWYSNSIDARQRRALDRSRPDTLRDRGSLLYLDAGEVEGTLRGGGSGWTPLVLFGGLVTVLLGLLGANRFLERFVRRERIDAWMAENVEPAD